MDDPVVTANYGWVKPNVRGSANVWGDALNADLDGIDSKVHDIDVRAIPAASDAVPAMDGTGAAGAGAAYARDDHTHPTDTTRAAATALASYLPLTGGTLTGALNGTTAAFSGVVNSAGGTLTGPLTVNASATFAAGIGGQFKVSIPAGATKANALHIDGPAGVPRAIVGSTAGSDRWLLGLGGSGAEGGSNAGSDFAINAYADDGTTLLSTPLIITRSSGAATFSNNVTALNVFVSGAAGTNRTVGGRTGISPRWDFILGTNVAEGGSNAGSDIALNSSADGGTYLGTPISVKRSTGVTTFSIAIVNGPSDRTLKENVEPITGALDKVNALQGVSFNMIATPDHREIGLIAQDVEPVVPEILQTFDHRESETKSTPKLALDYPKLVALLIEAVKELTARVAELEAVRG